MKDFLMIMKDFSTIIKDDKYLKIQNVCWLE